MALNIVGIPSVLARFGPVLVENRKWIEMTYSEAFSRRIAIYGTENLWLGMGCSLVVEHLPNSYKAVDSIPSTEKKR
jgi:hypothetical protein